MPEVLNVNDVLDGHVVLDLDCLDRIYLNGYVPKLQVGGQVITFLTQHLGNPVASPALFRVCDVVGCYPGALRAVTDSVGRPSPCASSSWL